MRLKILAIGLLLQTVWDIIFGVFLEQPSIDILGKATGSISLTPIRAFLRNVLIAPPLETLTTVFAFLGLLLIANAIYYKAQKSKLLYIIIALIVGIWAGTQHTGAAAVSATGGFILLMLGFVYHIKDDPTELENIIDGCVYMTILHAVHNFCVLVYVFYL